jgi:hypothetical protein
MSDQSPTLQPFEKVKPGDTDIAFRAACPKCDGHLWIFGAAKTSSLDSAIIDPDKRICSSCGYVHWLRGPNESEVIPLPAAPGASKKDRVRALVHSILLGGSAEIYTVVMQAEDIDSEIEAIK